MFGRGVPTDKLISARAERAISFLGTIGWSADVFPGESGEILISINRLADEFELVFELDGTVTLIQEEGQKDINRWTGISDNEAFEILQFSSWIISDYSIRVTGSGKKTDLAEWHSEITPSHHVVFLSWALSAQSFAPDPFASTFPSTIIDGQLPPFFGHSMTEYSPLMMPTTHPRMEGMSGATTNYAGSTMKKPMRFFKKIASQADLRITESAEAVA